MRAIDLRPLVITGNESAAWSIGSNSIDLHLVREPSTSYSPPCARGYHATDEDIPFQIHHWSDSVLPPFDLSIRSLALFRIDRDLESRIRLERRIRLSWRLNYNWIVRGKRGRGRGRGMEIITVLHSWRRNGWLNMGWMDDDGWRSAVFCDGL